MRFLASILTLLAVIFVICVPYFVGHGLAVHSSKWILTGIVCGVVAAVLIFARLRIRPAAGAAVPHA